ncbi:putative retrotransposon hot spot (RHS) protein, partial [Trypanosoma cruzi]
MCSTMVAGVRPWELFESSQCKRRNGHCTALCFFVWVAAPPRPIEMMEYLLYFHFACATQLPLLGHGDCVLVARAASSAVVPSLCWGSGRATALVEWRPSGRGKAPTAAECDSLCRRRSGGMVSLLPRTTEMDEDRTAPLSTFFIIAF